MTKKELQAVIDALDAELKTLRAADDQDAPPDWVWLRVALQGYVGPDPDHQDLINEATEIVKMWDDLPKDYAKRLELVQQFEPAEIEAMVDLYEQWTGHGLDRLADSLWRGGLLRNRGLFETLEELT